MNAQVDEVTMTVVAAMKRERDHLYLGFRAMADRAARHAIKIAELDAAMSRMGIHGNRRVFRRRGYRGHAGGRLPADECRTCGSPIRRAVVRGLCLQCAELVLDAARQRLGEFELLLPSYTRTGRQGRAP